MAYYPVEGSSKDLIQGKTVVLVSLSFLSQETSSRQPSVSLANLPQLAVDLLIHSLSLTLVGYIGTGSTVAPLVGSSKNGLSTGGLEGQLAGTIAVLKLTEVYSRDGLDFVVVQQRSPNLKVSRFCLFAFIS
jgi:proteasome assembly chaperone 2